MISIMFRGWYATAASADKQNTNYNESWNIKNPEKQNQLKCVCVCVF